MNNSINYIKCYDPLSRKPFYYNCRSHEAQWNLPQGAIELEKDIPLPKDDPTVCNYFAFVIKSYSKQNENEVSLAEKDIVHVFRKYKNGWGAGLTSLDESGYFPLCCTKAITPASDYAPTSTLLNQSGESVRNFIRDTNNSRSSNIISTKLSSDVTRVNSINLHNQRRLKSRISMRTNGNDDILLELYRIFIESVLSQEIVKKEEIEEIESIRQKYHIPLSSHLSILANIHEGTQSYIQYLEKFGIAGSREIKMIYSDEATTTNLSRILSILFNKSIESVHKRLDQSMSGLSCEEYNTVNHHHIERPFVTILSQDGIYRWLEGQAISTSDYDILYYASMYFRRDPSSKYSDSISLNFSPNVPTDSLLYMPATLVPQAIDAKKIVMMYMKDLPLTDNPSKLFDQLLAFLKNPYLADEIYCFLIIQTTANMQQTSEIRGWELFNVALAENKPSRNLFSYVLYYIIRSLFNSDINLTGLKLNALRLLLGQESSFQLSQSHLEHINQELLQACSFDCSLPELLRLENTMVLLTHYNLLPSYNLYGSKQDSIPVDYYDVDTNPRTVLNTLLTGALFTRRTFYTKAQKTRYLHISPSLHGIYFSRAGYDPEVFISLSDILNIDIRETDSTVPYLFITLTQKRTLVLQSASVLERSRWYFYLKVLIAWYTLMGYSIIQDCYNELTEEEQHEFDELYCNQLVIQASLSIQQQIASIQASFLHFLEEHSQPQSVYPHGIDLSYHSSTHTISFLLLSILHNLTRCKAFLILNPFKNLPEVDQSIKEQVYYGNYSILDTVDDPYQLFALLKDWLISLDDGLLPYDYLAQALQLIKQDKEAEMYDFLLNLPPVYRDTILYLARFVLAYISFKKSVTYDFTNYSFAKSYTFVFRSTKYSTEPFVNELSRQLIACILRVVSVHARESFLPPDPTINALSEYRVLLFSHIPPSPTAEGGYDYTIENVFTLEKTADMMFSYGILPEKNTFGCSYYRLPNVSETQLSLFYKSTECLIKTAETDIYSLGHLWISPSLSSLLYSLGNKIYYIPWKSIRRISGQPPVALDSSLQQAIQGRCLTVVCDIATTIDLLYSSVEPRNSMFNVLDLLMEWNREEGMEIRSKYHLKQEAEVLLDKCRDYSDVCKYAPSYIEYVNELHKSFSNYVKERDDRVSNVIFDLVPTKQKNEEKEDGQVKENPFVLRVFTMISQALVAMKAHLEEGVFRQSGSKQLGIEYKKQIRMGNYDIIKTITGYKELTSLLTSCMGFQGERLIPTSVLPTINEINKTRSTMKAYELLCKLPDINHYTLLYLCHLWYEISKYSDVNKMTIENICTCVCPSLIFVQDNTEFLRLVSPLFPFVKLLIQATNEIDLEKENIRLSFE